MRQMHPMRSIRALVLPLIVVAMMLGLGLPSAGSQPGPQVIRLLWVQTSNHPNGKKEAWTSQLLNETRQFGKPAGAKVGAEVGISHGPQFVGGIEASGRRPRVLRQGEAPASGCDRGAGRRRLRRLRRRHRHVHPVEGRQDAPEQHDRRSRTAIRLGAQAASRLTLSWGRISSNRAPAPGVSSR